MIFWKKFKRIKKFCKILAPTNTKSLIYPVNLTTTTHEEHIKNVFLVECPQTPNTEWIDRVYLMKLKLLVDLTTEYNRLTMSESLL